jgi:SAPK-interacting protein 1 (Sin1), middle CRIM domain
MAPQVTITAPSRSNSHRSDVRRSQTMPLRPLPHFRGSLDPQRQQYYTSSDEEVDTLRPRQGQPRKNSSDLDVFLDARGPSGEDSDDTEASESDADFAEAVGSAATNTILGFDIDQEKAKSPPPKPVPRREPSHGHFSPIPLTTTQPPVSALTALIKAKEQNSKEENHLAELYASFSGKGDLKPLHLKIFRPTSGEPTRPVDVVVRQDATVAETIGFSLYRYWEESRKPALKREECDANVWTLRIMEDVETVDDDFPALERIRPISRFQFDMFALVEATPEQSTTLLRCSNLVKQNMIETPTRVLKSLTITTPTTPSTGVVTPAINPIQPATSGRPNAPFRRSSNPGKSVLLRIRLYPYVEEGAQSTMLEVTTDNYLSEVLDLICKKLHLDKGMYVLRLPGTSIMVPPSRRVESLQGRTELELIKKSALEALSAAGSNSGTPNSTGTSRITLFCSG